MTCHWARQKLTAYIDQQLRADEFAVLRRHLLSCEDCHQGYEYQARLSSPLRELPRMAPPADLATSIRVRLSPQTRMSFWERWQVHLGNLMRPVALPAAGGLLTALILFGVLIPAVSFTRAAGADNDVPTVFGTEPRIKMASPFPMDQDLLVEAWVDEQGKISSFEVLNPASSVTETELRNQLSNVLLTMFFEPATAFGQPISGRMLLSFSRMSRVTIRG